MLLGRRGGREVPNKDVKIYLHPIWMAQCDMVITHINQTGNKDEIKIIWEYFFDK